MSQPERLVSLSPAEIARRLETLEAIISAGQKTFVEVGLALTEIRDTGLYKRDYATFEDYCQAKWGWGSRRAQQLVAAAQFQQGQKLLAEAGQDVKVPETEREAREGLKAKRRGKLPPLPPTLPAPPPPPAFAGFVPESVRRLIHTVATEAQKLLQSELAGSPAFRHLAAQLSRLDVLVQPELPGMAEAFPPKAKGRGTLEEVVEFFLGLKLPREDGEWFFNKCEGCGWTNNKQPIKDWRSTVRAWKDIVPPIFPSLKRAWLLTQTGVAPGVPVPMTQAEREVASIARRANA